MGKNYKKRELIKIIGKLTGSIFLLMVVLMLIPLTIIAQTDTVRVHSDQPPYEGNLNTAVKNAINDGNLSSTVFKLEPYGYYVLSDVITVPPGEHLTIVGPKPGTTQAEAPPQILWSSGIDPANIIYNFDCFGDITLKNVWLLYANTTGFQVPACLMIEDNAEANASGKGEIGIFENVIFDYSQAPSNTYGAVGIAAQHFRGTFTNCYFRNCTDPYFRYYGRAVALIPRDAYNHIDSIAFVNCTFANLGYVFAQELNRYSDYVWFNHCTFLNTMMFSLECISGWWHWLSVTNSIFLNMYMIGDIPSWRSSEQPYGGTISIDSLSSIDVASDAVFLPFNEDERHILFSNCSYGMEQWLTDFMAHNPYSDAANAEDKPVPQPMMNENTLAFFDDKTTWPHISMASIYDSTDPDFVFAPTNKEKIKQFLLNKWNQQNRAHTANWAYEPMSTIYQLWPLKEDLSYTNDSLKTAAMGGFPLGDLYRWWPELYPAWKAQEEGENENILNLLSGDIENQNALGSPILASPENNAQDQHADNLILSWYSVPHATYYEFQFSFVPSFYVLLLKDTTTDTVFTIDSLYNSQQYFWRVRAFNADSASNFSPLYSFTTAAITDVEERGELPRKFVLMQNFPNPFNPITTIKYQMAESGYVTLKIYDVLGREVETLVNEIKKAGYHSTSFNAESLSSGVYFYIISIEPAGQASRLSFQKKMLLLK